MATKAAGGKKNISKKLPIFVKTRTHYYICNDPKCDKKHSGSYTDYWDLVKLAEFPVCYVDEIDFESDNIYICSPINGEYNIQKKRKCKLIHWLLERPSEGLKVDDRFDETWISDRWFASLVPTAKYVTLGTDYRLRKGDLLHKKKYDFIHLSYLTDRRKRVIDDLAGRGFSFAPNSWGEERHIALCSSNAMLALHQDEYPVIEPLRYALASAYHLPILAEFSRDFYPFKIYKEYPSMIKLVWLENKNPLDEDYQFKKCIMEAL